MYKSACTKEAIIGRNLSNTDSKDGSNSQSWNDEDNAFEYQLYQWSVDNCFQTAYEVITRYLKICVEDREN